MVQSSSDNVLMDEFPFSNGRLYGILILDMSGNLVRSLDEIELISGLVLVLKLVVLLR